MDTLRFLIPYFLKIAFSFFFVAIIWWLVTILFPGLNVKVMFLNAMNSTGTSTLSEILPSPRAFGKIMGRASTTGSMPTVYVHGKPYSGYAMNSGATSSKYTYSTYNYVTYTENGKVITDANGNIVSQNSQNNTGVRATTSQTLPGLSGTRSMYIRNLSIYENGHIYTNLSFIGEARSNMFKEGKFPIAVVDQAGRLVGISVAVATTDWTVAGWTRFQTKITYTLPPNSAPCTMVFEEALTAAEKAIRKPLQVPMHMKCN